MQDMSLLGRDVLDMWPIYHRIDSRVQVHIDVAELAFLLHRAIEKKLRAARLDLSATGSNPRNHRDIHADRTVSSNTNARNT